MSFLLLSKLWTQSGLILLINPIQINGNNRFFSSEWIVNRLSISFFAISGLDVLDSLNLIEKQKQDIVNWVYQFQIISDHTGDGSERCGFRGSLAATQSLDNDTGAKQLRGSRSHHVLDTSHITMTYSAINTLLILGDDLTRLDKKGILAGVKALQLENGR